MPLRVPRTSFPQDPQRPSAAGGSSIVPVQAVGNPAAAGASVAQNAAGLAAQLYQEERDREVQTRVLELDIQRRKADDEVISGYTQSLGKNAVERRGEVLAAIAANSKAVREGIKDRAVAEVWAKQDAALTRAATAELDDHYRRQNIKWQADTQEARADLLVSSLGRVAFGEGWDPATGRLSDEAERTRSSYRDTIGELGAVLGWSTEQIESARRTADTKALGQVAESLVRQDRFDEAQKVLEAHGDKIDVGARDRLGEMAREGKARKAAERKTQMIAEKAQAFTLRTADLAAARGGTIAEQEAWALSTAEHTYRGGKLTAEEYDSALQRIERHFKIRDAREAAGARQVVVDAERFLAENLLATLEDNPPLFEAAKRAGQLKGLLEFQRSGRYSTDPEVYARARAIPDADLRRIPADRLWVELRPRLSNQDLDDIMARQARAVGNANAEQLHVLGISDRVEMTARSLGILPAAPGVKLSAEQQKNFDAWRLQFDGDLKAWQTTHGKKASVDDVQKLLDLQSKDYVDRVSKGLVWNSVTRVPTALLGDRQTSGASVVVGSDRIDVKRVPEQSWAGIAAYLQEIGVDPTWQNIVDRWVAIGRPGDIVRDAVPASSASGPGPSVTTEAVTTTEQQIEQMRRRVVDAGVGPSAGGGR